jgi:predicted Zn-dependent peptidase
MYAYFETRYVAPNITVAAAGSFNWKQLVTLVEKHCAGWATGAVPRKGIREARGTGAFEVVQKDKVVQEHVFLISPGPPIRSPLRYAADTLALIVGDDSGSRLYWALIDPGLADTADCSFHDYEGTGSFYTSFSGEPGQAQKNLAIVHRVLAAVQRDGVTEEELRQAKSKILSRVVRGSERPMGRMQAIGMSWIYLHRYRTADEELKAFDAVTVKAIRRLLDRYPIDQVTTLALGPLEKMRRVRGNGRNGRR